MNFFWLSAFTLNSRAKCWVLPQFRQAALLTLNSLLPLFNKLTDLRHVHWRKVLLKDLRLDIENSPLLVVMTGRPPSRKALYVASIVESI